MAMAAIAAGSGSKLNNWLMLTRIANVFSACFNAELNAHGSVRQSVPFKKFIKPSISSVVKYSQPSREWLCVGAAGWMLISGANVSANEANSATFVRAA